MMLVSLQAMFKFDLKPAVWLWLLRFYEACCIVVPIWFVMWSLSFSMKFTMSTILRYGYRQEEAASQDIHAFVFSVVLYGKRWSLCFQPTSTLFCCLRPYPILENLRTGWGKWDQTTSRLTKGGWSFLPFRRTKKKDIYVISTLKRPVPLEHHLYAGKDLFKIVGANEKKLNGTA